MCNPSNVSSIKFFIALYISVHLIVSFFGIRVWPFTDYPMFGIPFPKQEVINQFSLVFIDASGKEFTTVIGGFGAGDPVLGGLLGQKMYAAIDEHVKSQASRLPIKPVSYKIKSKQAFRTANDKFEIKDVILFEGNLN